MEDGKDDGKSDERNACDHDSRKEKDDRGNDREQQGFGDSRFIPKQNPSEAIGKNEHGVDRKVNEHRVREMKPQIGVGDIENHKHETAVSADLLQQLNRFIAVSAPVAFMFYGINYIRRHDNSHEDEPVIIKPPHTLPVYIAITE